MTNQRLWEQNCCGADLASGNNVRRGGGEQEER